MIIEKPLNVIQVTILCALQSDKMFDHKCKVTPIKNGLSLKLRYAPYVVNQGLLPRVVESLPFCNIQYADSILTIILREEKKSATKKSKSTIQVGE